MISKEIITNAAKAFMIVAVIHLVLFGIVFGAIGSDRNLLESTFVSTMVFRFFLLSILIGVIYRINPSTGSLVLLFTLLIWFLIYLDLR